MTANPLADTDQFTPDYMIINALGVLDATHWAARSRTALAAMRDAAIT